MRIEEVGTLAQSVTQSNVSCFFTPRVERVAQQVRGLRRKFGRDALVGLLFG